MCNYWAVSIVEFEVLAKSHFMLPLPLGAPGSVELGQFLARPFPKRPQNFQPKNSDISVSFVSLVWHLSKISHEAELFKCLGLLQYREWERLQTFLSV